MKEAHENIELRSEEVQEIMGTPPGWIVRYGTTGIVATILALAVVSWLIRYPDVVTAPISIKSDNPHRPVVAQTSGYIEKFLVEENDEVNKGDLLILMQNTANYEDVNLLDTMLHDLKNMNLTVRNLRKFKPQKGLVLGTLQRDYSTFLQNYESLFFDATVKVDQRSIQQKKDRIAKVEQAIGSLKENYKTAVESYNIASARARTSKQMYEDDVLTLVEFQEARERENRAEQEAQSINGGIIEKQSEIKFLEGEILGVKSKASRSTSEKLAALQTSISELRSSLDSWKQQYLMRAQVPGITQFYKKFFIEQQFVKTGDQVMAILPLSKDEGDITARGDLPILGSGKVEVGQKVILKMSSYPHMDFGTIEGVLSVKKSLPNSRGIPIEIKLPNGLKTSYNKELKFEQEMVGIAEIVTEDKRLFERLFEKFISLFRN